MAVSVLKGGGALMRNIGGGVGSGSARPLCCRYRHCHWQLKRKENGNGNLKITMRSRTISLSPSAATAARRIFCTAFQNLMDSSDPSSSSSSSSSSAYSTTVGGDGLDSDLKNAANMLDIRVGRILRAWRHEEADSLYVEEVDIGEPQPRIICSGLVNYIPLHQLQDSNVVVLANLKPRNMCGVKSFGMLMAASDTTRENVELLVPPEGSLPGERIWFGFADEKENLPVAATPNQIQKKKIWEFVQPHLRTDTSCAASLGVHFMRTSAGVVVCRSLKNANIS